MTPAPELAVVDLGICGYREAWERQLALVEARKDGGGVDTLLLGMGLPDDNAHSPNEKFDLDCFARGQEMAVHLWQELSGAAL